MSEEEAHAAFMAIRFAENGGEPFCVWCDCAAVYTLRRRITDKAGKVRTRTLFKCKSCLRQFSVTSRTIFASRKMEMRDILYAITLFANGAKGVSALQLCRDLNVQAKTAFVLEHKLREALGLLQQAQELSGEVEIDGAYFGGKVRKQNDRTKQPDLRRLENQSPKRRCVVIMRERNGRSRPFVCSELEGARLVPSIVKPGSILYADEAKSYDSLHALFEMRRIDHSKRYADGVISTNWAESYYARLRRSQWGVYHHFSPDLTIAYANEMSWREDNRRRSNGEQFLEIAAAGLHAPVSRRWKGYWQRRREAA